MGQNGLCCKPKRDLIYQEASTERRISVKSQSIHSSQNSPSFDYSHSMSEIGIINRYIRGWLLRKHYHFRSKHLLVESTHQIVSDYMNRIAFNELVLQIEKNKVNKSDRSDGWKDFYKNNPLPSATIPSHLFQTVHIKYSKNSTTTLKSKETSFSPIWLYEGTMDINGNYQGFGVKTHKNGTKEIGNWTNSVFNGWNKVITDKGLLFIGLFSKGVLYGKGIRLSIVNNTLYKGDFVNGLREGKGFETSPTCTYEGSYANDTKSGKGSLRFTSGDSYEGEFANNVFNGLGHYIWKNGREYIGEYKEGKFHGQGYYKMDDNEYFKGNYVEGRKEGEGEMKYADGKKYICTFVEGKAHGKGIFENKEGKRIAVDFINGKINKSKGRKRQ